MHPYSTLTPDLVVESIEAVGYMPDGRVLALNSYENRVYQVGRDDGPPVVVKFYRPGRWTTPQTLEEHEFAAELARAEIPVVAPEVHDCRTLFVENRFSATITSNQPQRSLSSFAIIQPSSFLILHEVSLVSLAYGIHRET